MTSQYFNRNDKDKTAENNLKRVRKNITFYLILPKLKHELEIQPWSRKAKNIQRIAIQLISFLIFEIGIHIKTISISVVGGLH